MPVHVVAEARRVDQQAFARTAIDASPVCRLPPEGFYWINVSRDCVALTIAK